MCWNHGRSQPFYNRQLLLYFCKMYEIKVFYLSITGGYGVHTYKGVRCGTVRNTCFWVRVRYVPAFGYGYGTVRVRWGYGTGTVWVYSTGTVRRYGVLVQCTRRTCFQKKWYYFENVALIVAHFGNSTALSKNRYSGYDATPCLSPIGVPYPYRTRTVPVPVPYSYTLPVPYP